METNMSTSSKHFSLTEEEENLLLNPFLKLDMDDGASAMDVDGASEVASVTSSNVSNVSNASRRSRISNCKRTIKRLGKLDWDQMSEMERMRLHNARAFLDREVLVKDNLTSSHPSLENSGCKTLMGPPAPYANSKRGKECSPSTPGAKTSNPEQTENKNNKEQIGRTHIREST